MKYSLCLDILHFFPITLTSLSNTWCAYQISLVKFDSINRSKKCKFLIEGYVRDSQAKTSAIPGQHLTEPSTSVTSVNARGNIAMQI